MQRLGVLGTMVWDRIHTRDGRAEPIEEWGGISYALAAAAAAREPGWQIVPILRVGTDLRESALRFLRLLPGLDLDRGVRFVDEPTNRVELRYVDSARRTERLTGGVSPWPWEQLEPIVRDLDALYINFISGFELTLETAQQLRLAFDGPIYADLHSLFLALGPGGLRAPQPLEAWREWMRCFDIIQLNEDELGLLASAWGGDPWRFAADVVGNDLRLLLVTLGQRGAAYVASPAFEPDPLNWRAPARLLRPALVASPGAATSERLAVIGGPRDGDPTGCGDVWGATLFSRLAGGAPLLDAMRLANTAAARNVQHRGAAGLHHHLVGRIGS